MYDAPEKNILYVFSILALLARGFDRTRGFVGKGWRSGTGDGMLLQFRLEMGDGAVQLRIAACQDRGRILLHHDVRLRAGSFHHPLAVRRPLPVVGNEE